MPLISVLIPSLNSQDYIGQCVESVVQQSLEDIEIICIDAGSDDKTVEILNKLADNDSRITIIHSDRRSYGYQMNMGLASSTGEYISIVESDDYIDKNMLEDLYDLAKKYDCDIAKSTFYHVYDDELVIDDSKKDLDDVNDSFKLTDQPTFIHGHPSIWAGIYRNSFLKDKNISFLEENGAGWVDNPFFYETAVLAQSIVYRHKPYYFYRETNQESSSNSLGDYNIPIKRMRDNLDILDKYDCHEELILKEAYIRAFAYIRIILRSDDEKILSDLRPSIRQMLLGFDEEIILKHLRRKWIDMYYRFISPVPLLDSNNSEITLSKEDFDLIVKEHEYLYSRIDDYKSKNLSLKEKNKKLKQELKSIKQSNDNKSGFSFKNPLRK